jgi:hypothetical protein
MEQSGIKWSKMRILLFKIHLEHRLPEAIEAIRAIERLDHLEQ